MYHNNRPCCNCVDHQIPTKRDDRCQAINNEDFIRPPAQNRAGYNQGINEETINNLIANIRAAQGRAADNRPLNNHPAQNHPVSNRIVNEPPAAVKPDTNRQPSENDEEKSIVFKHDKDGLAIHITIYNTNNNANEGSEAGLKQKAENGGQIAGKCGKNANQDSKVSGASCEADEYAEQPEEEGPSPNCRF